MPVNSETPETPTEVAIRQLVEARNILSALILSSESFDYPKAKIALIDLDRKIRELGREEARLQSAIAGRREGRKIVPFPQL